jgi:hypothetical protein
MRAKLTWVMKTAPKIPNARLAQAWLKKAVKQKKTIPLSTCSL